jgi:hypothetical protein
MLEVGKRPHRVQLELHRAVLVTSTQRKVFMISNNYELFSVQSDSHIVCECEYVHVSVSTCM